MCELLERTVWSLTSARAKRSRCSSRRNLVSTQTIGLVSRLKHVVQTVLALGNTPRTAVANIKDSPIRSFEGKTALEMIAADRTDDVVAYLESLSAGWVG